LFSSDTKGVPEKAAVHYVERKGIVTVMWRDQELAIAAAPGAMTSTMSGLNQSTCVVGRNEKYRFALAGIGISAMTGS
jgi:hypothetical protein